MRKTLIAEGTLGYSWMKRGLCPQGDGGQLKRNRCQTCFRLYSIKPSTETSANVTIHS